MLENHFLIYREQITRFLRWMSCKIHTFLQWPEFNVRLSDFKMADDIQKKQFMLQLNQMRKVSDSYLLEDSGLDVEEQLRLIREETIKGGEIAKLQQLEAARAQGEAMKIQLKHQAEAEIEGQAYRKQLLEDVGKESEREAILKGIDNPFGPDTSFSQFDPMQLAELTLQKLKSLPKDMRDNQLKLLQDDYPQLVSVMNRLAGQKVQMHQENLSMMHQQEQQEQVPHQEIKPASKPKTKGNKVVQESKTLDELKAQPGAEQGTGKAPKPLPEQKPPRGGPGRSTI